MNGFNAFIQIIGFAAFGLGVTAFAQSDDRRFRLLMTAQAMTLAVHLWLLDACAGAASAGVTGIRNYLSLFGWTKRLAPLFALAVIIFGVLGYESWPDVLPIVAGVMATYAVFYTQGTAMRGIFMTTSAMWLTHNIWYGAIGPSLMDAAMIGMNAYTIWRIYKGSSIDGASR